MCGRYALFRWSQDFAALPGFPSDQRPHWSLAPGASVLLLRQADSGLQLDRVRWGLTPAWLTDLPDPHAGPGPGRNPGRAAHVPRSLSPASRAVAGQRLL